MKERAKKVFDLRILVSLIGLILSVVLHELFHIVMHWGHISSVVLLPGNGSLVEITSVAQLGYDLQLEEFIAYTITVFVMLATIITVWKIHDKKDTRTAHQIIFTGYSR